MRFVTVTVAADRIMESNDPDGYDYQIVRADDDSLARAFHVGPVNNKTADETAEANVADWSEHHPGEWMLFRDGLLLAWARSGVIYSLRPDNPALVRTGKEAA